MQYAYASPRAAKSADLGLEILIAVVWIISSILRDYVRGKGGKAQFVFVPGTCGPMQVNFGRFG